MIRNNVTRLLDQRKIPYEAFELPEEKLGAKEAAELLGVPPTEVYKTIVVLRAGKGKHLLVLAPATHVVDLKAVAQAAGEKKVTLPTQREAERLTGLQAGGISPLALFNRPFEVFIDTNALSLEQIYISGGQRGINIRLRVRTLADLTGAKFYAVSSHE